MNRVQTQVVILTLDMNNPNDRLKLNAIEKLEDTHGAINEFKEYLVMKSKNSEPEEPTEDAEKRMIATNHILDVMVQTFSKYGIAV